jgi:hypothetical protein
MGRAYADSASSSNSGMGILGLIILFAVTAFIIANLMPKESFYDNSQGSYQQSDNEEEKCSTPGCINTTDIVDGKCSACRWREQHRH